MCRSIETPFFPQEKWKAIQSKQTKTPTNPLPRFPLLGGGRGGTNYPHAADFPNPMKADKSNYYAYNPHLKERAKSLRKNMTKAEACLWKYALRARMRKGFSFKRQRSVLQFIADFMCKELKLIIEVDGPIHDLPEVQFRDQFREEKLREAGFTILRFTNEEVLTNINGVIQAIDAKIDFLSRE